MGTIAAETGHPPSNKQKMTTAFRDRFSNDNRLLQSLDRNDGSLLRPHLSSVQLRLGQDLERPKRPIENVYFIEHGIVSVIAVHPSGFQVEIALLAAKECRALP